LIDFPTLSNFIPIFNLQTDLS